MLIANILTSEGILRQKQKRKKERNVVPREDSATVTFILPGATHLAMRLPIRLHRILLRALLTLPLLLAVLPEEVLLNAGQVAQCPRRVMVHACHLRADVYLLSNHLLAWSLLQLPWQVVASPVELEVLVSLETLVAYLAYKPVCRHQGFWGQSYHFCFWVCYGRRTRIQREVNYKFIKNMCVQYVCLFLEVVLIERRIHRARSLFGIRKFFVILITETNWIY